MRSFDLGTGSLAKIRNWKVNLNGQKGVMKVVRNFDLGASSLAKIQNWHPARF